MLWSLAVVAVRQKHDKTLLDIPLGFTGSDHGIDDNLSSVCEVTKLSLPTGQGVRVGLGVAILETETGILGQVRVANLEALYLRVRDDCGHRDVGLITLLVEDN